MLSEMRGCILQIKQYFVEMMYVQKSGAKFEEKIHSVDPTKTSVQVTMMMGMGVVTEIELFWVSIVVLLQETSSLAVNYCCCFHLNLPGYH